jgi:hypothetical protein
MGTATTPARAEASRSNGQKGRGPVTPEGKARSSRNASRHGILTANACVGDTPEQRDAFEALLDQLRAELAPSSVLESLLIERIGATLWRTRRVIDFESGVTLERDSTPEPHLDRLLRDLESGGPDDPEALQRGKALARSLAPEGALDLVMRYESHLTRETGRLLGQLEHARRLTALNSPM